MLRNPTTSELQLRKRDSVCQSFLCYLSRIDVIAEKHENLSLKQSVILSEIQALESHFSELSRDLRTVVDQVSRTEESYRVLSGVGEANSLRYEVHAFNSTRS